jgi:hypothetical protein
MKPSEFVSVRNDFSATTNLQWKLENLLNETTFAKRPIKLDPKEPLQTMSPAAYSPTNALSFTSNQRAALG